MDAQENSYEMPAFNEQLQYNTIIPENEPVIAKKTKQRKLTKKQKPKPNCRKSYSMFPASNDINLSADNLLDNNIVENEVSNILDDISIVPASINSIEIDPPNINSNINMDQPVSISVPIAPYEASFPPTFTDIDFDGVYLPPDFESINLDMNQILTATATSTAAVGVLATIYSTNSKEPTPNKNSKTNEKEINPKEKQTNPKEVQRTSNSDDFLNLFDLIRSPSQQDTPADGNCLYHAIFDQVIIFI